MELVAAEGEAYVGFGEKIGPIDKRGLRFTFWNTDAYPPEPHTDRSFSGWRRSRARSGLDRARAPAGLSEARTGARTMITPSPYTSW